MVVGSVAVSLAKFVSPPPATVVEFVKVPVAPAATFTVTVMTGYADPFASTSDRVQGPAGAVQAQPVPIPEDVAAMPQIEIDGVGIGTVGYGNRVEDNRSSYRGAVDFSDSALLFGATQRLYEGGGIGSMGFGLLAPDTANSGTGSPLLIHQAFLDYQTERMEWLIGSVVRAVGWRRRADQSRRSNRRLSGLEGSLRIISSNSTGVRYSIPE